MTSVNAVIVESAICVLRLLFQTLDILLSIFQTAQQQLLPTTPSSNTPPAKTVVIVGGNFAGLVAWQYLREHTDGTYNVVLIDQRSYSEYTPGILRLFCAPDEFRDLAQPLPASQPPQYQLLQGKVTSLVDENGNKLLSYTPGASSSTLQTLSYDYAIVATGSSYHSSTPISPTPQEVTWEQRFQGWKTAHTKLQKAKSVIILGGGAVGVELAAEIVEHFDDKPVTLLDACSRLVSNFSPKVSDYALQWLRSKNVNVRLGQSLQSWTETSCTLQDGTVLQADLVYVCFGSKPNSNMLQSSTPSLLGCLTKRQNIQVKDTLQLAVAAGGGDFKMVASCIFACGDVAMPPTSGEDQAFQAEIQGKVAAINVLKLLQSTKTQQKATLHRYPQDIAFGSTEMPMVYILSLGKHNGVLGFNSLVIPGPLAAVAKFVLEFTKVFEMRGSLLGKLIWKLADAAVLFLSSTLLPPVPKHSTATKQIKAA